jgi:hypothetical protein
MMASIVASLLLIVVPFAIAESNTLDHIVNLIFNGTVYPIKYHLDKGTINQIIRADHTLVVMLSSPPSNSYDTLTIEIPRNVTSAGDGHNTKLFVYEGFINGQGVPFREVSSSSITRTLAIEFNYSNKILQIQWSNTVQ